MSAPLSTLLVVAGSKTETVEVVSEVGQWAVHRALRRSGWTVTHTGCGIAVGTFRTKREAMAVANVLAPVKLSKRCADESLVEGRSRVWGRAYEMSRASRDELRKLGNLLREIGAICAIFITLLLASSPVLAQDDSGLVDANLVGDPAPSAPVLLRPQLREPASAAPAVIGGVSLAVGGMALVGSFAVYVARQNYRLTPRTSLSADTIDSWSTMGAWSLWLGVGASALLVTGEVILLPESLDVPVLAWIGSGAGVVLAAVGIGFTVGGTHCGPESSAPGSTLRLACTAGTSDAVFGPLLIATSIPLLNLAGTYLFRKLFAGAPESLSIGPGSVEWRGRF